MIAGTGEQMVEDENGKPVVQKAGPEPARRELTDFRLVPPERK